MDKTLNPTWLTQGYSRVQDFQYLMQYRIRNVLLVSSLYDLFLFEEDGRLYELLREEYRDLNLSLTPDITRVSSGHEAIALAKAEKRYDLIITTLHIKDLPAYEFARLVRESGLNIPIVLLAYDHRELSEMLLYHKPSMFDHVFVWQGDFRIIIAIIKYLEDRTNVEQDTSIVGVQAIILIEDQVRYYSSLLPIIYKELFNQAQRLISEGINLSHKFLRMRARPKILLCTNYEEAWEYFSRYKEYILGIISDVDFRHGGKEDPEAGLEFARRVKQEFADIPILLQSYVQENAQKAHEIGAAFLLKDSPTLLHELRHFMLSQFGFGDFVFRTHDGREVGRATDLRSLERLLHTVPEESIKFHGERNHFSNWLKARTEFGLAHRLRPRRVSDYATDEELRQDLIASLREYRRVRQRGMITDFSRETFYPYSSFARIGRGSLGGKARGLTFVNRLIYNYQLHNKFTGVEIYVPPAVVLGTDVFDQFLDENNLRDFALHTTDDHEITRRFLQAPRFPKTVEQDLADFLDIIKIPLAVRSSSLMEDSQYYPFAGVYKTYMLPNNNEDHRQRLQQLVNAIKRVYASTFFQNAKDYFKVTSYRLEEEKMAVVIQKLVGSQHENRFYPDCAGVAKSYNFYPITPQKSTDGVAIVALGLGKTVVDGGLCVKFSPKYPNQLPQFYTVTESLKNNQQSFYALNLEGHLSEFSTTADMFRLLQSCELEVAEKDGTLKYVGSTYSHENNTIYDGISRRGPRLVTFAPILKQRLFPLPEILEMLLEMGEWSLGTPVEIEFAVSLSGPENRPKEFAFLQLRPLALRHEFDVLDIDETAIGRLICRSNSVLGNGVIDDIHDVVMVDINDFDRLRSHEVAKEVSIFNSKLLAANRPYVLVGVGRWGSLDPFLGIPVKWEHISGACAIVETGFKNMSVAPSQGSHFFHNLTSFSVGYFSISSDDDQNFIDWNWLLDQEPREALYFARHLHFSNPLTIKMNGRQNKGVILKPGNHGP
ncbi:MAG TPA: PEP/pyruvate-binding domain-containing protein [bacterium]